MLEPLRKTVEAYKKLPEGISWIAFHLTERFLSIAGTYILWLSIFIASVILIKPELIRRKEKEEIKEPLPEINEDIKIVKVSKPEESDRKIDSSGVERQVKSENIKEKLSTESEKKGFIIPPISLLKIEKK